MEKRLIRSKKILEAIKQIKRANRNFGLLISTIEPCLMEKDLVLIKKISQDYIGAMHAIQELNVNSTEKEINI